MKENYEALISLETGSLTIIPDIISDIERGEEPYIKDKPGPEERETGRSSCSEIDDPKNINTERDRWELSESLEGNYMLSKREREDVSSYFDWGKNQCSSEKRQINSSGDSALCKPSASNIAHTGEEERNQTTAEAYLCDVCGIFLRDPVTLKSHQSFHSEERPSTCTDCGKTFSQKGELLEQEKSRIDEKLFICSDCGVKRLLEVTEYGKNFIVTENLTNYQKGCPEENQFSCNKSDFQRAFTEHQNIYPDGKPFSCTKCNKCFSKKEALVRHQKIHTGVKEFTCMECGKSFWEKGYLTKHQKIHTGVKPFTCGECGKSFLQKSTLIIHQGIHTEVKTFTCKECGKSFEKNSYLVTHQRIHTGVKPFTCSECGKSFSQQWYLASHQKIHKEVKVFTCINCGKSFNRSSHLRKHQRIHTQEPFNCTECGKNFRCKSNLTNHQTVHKEMKAFTCTVCGNGFRYKSNLTNHQKIHTVEIAVIDASEKGRKEIQPQTQTGVLVCASNTQEKSTETRQQNKECLYDIFGQLMSNGS
ncbi:gastrula zinc finger protein XlCGF57.1-like [Rhinatrema bivittatum]|uniref:gastrula zinc finger protein XlCGF57.1-like n=1 Tax=Rhinatrema bivittatum TaxID=194408 RepID=UPI00112C3B83|nr:gastrula zinc finger protein XlCGF57.1-like [Rhinatrema bivittatum]